MGKENDYALGAVVRYGFHINIYKKFGLILGTSSQLMWDSHSYLTFKPGPHVIFPSATVGFVQNFKSDMRVSVLGEYAAAWLPFAKGMSESGNEMELAMIPDTFQFAMQLDKFVAPGRALSILIGMRVMPKSYEYSFEDQKFMNESVFCQAGMTWELGKDLTR